MLRPRQIGLLRGMDPHARAFAFLGIKSRLNPIPDDLVVSDSDPDSTLRNITAKAISTSKTQSGGGSSSFISASRSIKGLSEGSSHQRLFPDIIELSDDDSEEIEVTEENRLFSTTLPVVQPQRDPPRVAGSISSRFSFGAIANGNASDSETRSIDLGRLAYPGPSSQPRSRAGSQCSVRSITTLHSIRSVSLENSSKVRTIHSATDFLTDREIGLLSRCVACDIAWTTKKTVPKKRYHLRICQKKNALTDDTIHQRIEQELSKVVKEDKQKKGRGKVKEKSVSPIKPVTLMNTVVHETRPKKRVRRKEKPTTIVGIENQHDTIQDKARWFLGLYSDEEDWSTPGESAATSTAVPLTQEFPTSKLGNQKAFGMDVATSPVPSDDEEVSLSPSFCQETEHSQKPISISSDSESRMSAKYSPLSLQGNGRHRDLPEGLRQSLTLQNGEDELMKDLQREIDNRESIFQWKDGGRLDLEIFTEGVGWGGPLEDDAMQVDGVQKKRIRKPKVLATRGPVFSKSLVTSPGMIRPLPAANPSPAKRKTSSNSDRISSPTKSRSLNTSEDMDQANFDHLMQQRIMGDAALWQRVLRYEPVNFMEFLDIALAAGVPSRKLTDKLRVFLISKAIQVIMPKRR